MEGQDLFLTVLVALPAEEQEHWHTCQRPQWEEVRGTSAVGVKVHGMVQQLVPPVPHCEPFEKEVEAEEHLVDYQNYSRYSGG